MSKTKKEKDEFEKLVKVYSPNSHLFTDCVKAFFVGGIICTVGQTITNIILYYGFTKDEAALMTTIILILLSVILTSFGAYSVLGKFAGAGSIVPITGFANAVCAPAIEYKKEGMVLGVGAKMFIIAGPVIVYGVISSVIVGFVHFILKFINI